MVSRPPGLQIAWSENPAPGQDAQVAAQIAQALTSALPDLSAGCKLLYFALPNPAPYAAAHSRLLAALPAGAVIRTLVVPNNGLCYVAADTASFQQLLPLTFRLGPPELTLVSVQGALDMDTPSRRLWAALQAVLRSKTCADLHASAGLRFDSGDLLERF